MIISKKEYKKIVKLKECLELVESVDNLNFNKIYNDLKILIQKTEKQNNILLGIFGTIFLTAFIVIMGIIWLNGGIM